MNAPIVLFTFSRPEHTKRTLSALAANPLAKGSELIVYSDAPRFDTDAPLVSEVRELLYSIEGFHRTKVVERKTNYGLARNIIAGVSEVCSQFGSAIVLEDDIVTSPYFLTFMNKALDTYANKSDVWHISGWNYPIDPKGLDDAFFWRVMNCWGWATWQDRWQHFKKDPVHLIDTWDDDEIRRFNLDGAVDFWSQVKANQDGSLNTWAIFWYACIFEHQGLCLNPAVSLVRNIGHDGSGSNCREDAFLADQLLWNNHIDLPLSTIESQLALRKVKRLLFKQKLTSRVWGAKNRLKAFMRRNQSP